MPFKAKAKIEVKAYQLTAFLDSLKKLKTQKVLVGFPANEAPREDAEGNPEPITNAALGYIHNFGAPEANIPARPFMREGVINAWPEIERSMYMAGLAALDGEDQKAHGGLVAVGLAAQAGIQKQIGSGSFEPLAESTLEARARRGRSGAQDELDRRRAGEAPSTPDEQGFQNARALVDTGQMQKAVTFIVK